MESDEQAVAINVYDSQLLIRNENSRREQPSDNTCRPSFKPEASRGQDFQPLQLGPHREPVISPLPSSPLALFKLFLPPSTIDDWVKYTNEAPVPGPAQHASRKLQWSDTFAEEVYLFIGFIIYMGLHRETRIHDYWVTSNPNNLYPTHPIIRYMTFNRFELLYRRIRPFSSDDSNNNAAADEDQKNTPRSLQSRTFQRVNAWSEHLQAISLQLWQPGTNLAVDECINGFKGKAKEKITIKTKPTPTGYKIWAIAQHGYFLRWIWHEPRSAFGPVGAPSRRKRKRADDEASEVAADAADVAALNPTQSVVVALLNLLPKASYHVFLDNLFSSPSLFRVLRQRGIAATGTCRVNSGIYKPFVEAKAEDNRGICWSWNTLKAVPTPDNQVNQIAWKDNALALFLTTFYHGHERKLVRRKRPTTTHTRAKPIKREFGDAWEKVLALPSLAADYNAEMGSVDQGDQLRSYLSFQHRFRRGGWQALQWSFLLEVALINSYLLQFHSTPNWQRFTNQKEWRQQLVDDICKAYGRDGSSRQRFRSGDVNTAISQHNHVNRKKRAACLACQGHRIGQIRSRSQSRKVLGEVDGNSLNKKATKPAKTEWGCDTCDVAICKRQDCWYFYHQPIC